MFPSLSFSNSLRKVPASASHWKRVFRLYPIRSTEFANSQLKFQFQLKSQPKFNPQLFSGSLIILLAAWATFNISQDYESFNFHSNNRLHQHWDLRSAFRHRVHSRKRTTSCRPESSQVQPRELCDDFQCDWKIIQHSIPVMNHWISRQFQTLKIPSYA